MKNLQNTYDSEMNKTKISLVGIGAGTSDTFTLEAINTCLEADLLIGAKRMLQAVENLRKETFGDEEDLEEIFLTDPQWDFLEEYRPKEIAAYIGSHPEYANVVVVLSGDVGFYSGAKKLKAKLEEHEILGERQVEISMLPGISSVVYFAAKLGISWEDAAFASIHGRQEDILGIVKENEKTFVLAGESDSVEELIEKFAYYGLEDLKIYVGKNLSYETEEIIELTMKGLETSAWKKQRKDEKKNLFLLYIYNPQAGKMTLTPGIPDEEFLRGSVPMTKEEVRSVSLSKMHLKKESIVYDIGAGTGSVSVEAAILATRGRVYAVECNPEAVDLIKQNARKFQLDNISVVEGMAPEVMEDLPAPDVVFVGGSKGHLRKILKVVMSKKKIQKEIRVVINAITLETLSEALACCKELDVAEDEILELQVSKASSIGNYHLMRAHNPIYVISFTLKGSNEREI